MKVHDHPSGSKVKKRLAPLIYLEKDERGPTSVPPAPCSLIDLRVVDVAFGAPETASAES